MNDIQSTMSISKMFPCIGLTGHVTGRDMPSSPQYEGKFAISDDGIITVIGDLDREMTANYTFDVLASDLDPFHPRHNTTFVEIEVADSNDNSPVFLKKSYEADLIEHSSLGARALKVKNFSRLTSEI